MWIHVCFEMSIISRGINHGARCTKTPSMANTSLQFLMNGEFGSLKGFCPNHEHRLIKTKLQRNKVPQFISPFCKWQLLKGPSAELSCWGRFHSFSKQFADSNEKWSYTDQFLTTVWRHVYKNLPKYARPRNSNSECLLTVKKVTLDSYHLLMDYRTISVLVTFIPSYLYHISKK